jgi:signal peptidase I
VRTWVGLLMKQVMDELRVGPKDFEILTRQLMERGTQIRFRAYGNSMYPAIANGEAVTVAPLREIDDIRIGDIVLGSINDRLIAHRVMGIKKAGQQHVLFIKGDSISHVDEIRWEEVLGKVIEVERGNKQLKLDTSMNRLKGVLVMGLSAIGLWLSPRIRKLKKLLGFR